MNYDYKILKPFKWFVLQNFPFIEADFDAITNWQLFCKLGEEINKHINSMNLTGEQVENLTNAFNNLEAYVNNYFDNLDVQDEVNEKLDEMAEGGELAEIISQYLQTQAIIGFNTNASLKSAENLANGSFVRTYGKLAYNDGKGAFYKIRETINSDVPDDDNIIALTNYPTLVAEKMPDFNINQLNTQVSTINQKISPFTDKKWIFIGDSYSEGYSPDGSTNSWSNRLKEKMGLNNTNCQIYDHGGASFGNSGAYLFSTIINELSGDSAVTDILIGGGYNDITISEANIISGINDCNNLIAQKFPNAKVHLAFIGGTTNQYHGNVHLKVISYQKGALNYGWDFLANVWYPLYSESLFATDGIHPNNNGQLAICNALYQALNGGYNYYLFNDLVIDNTQTDYGFTGTMNLHHYSNNGISYLANYSDVKHLIFANTGFNLAYNGTVKIGKLQTRDGIIGTNYEHNNLLTMPDCIVHNWGTGAEEGYFTVPMQLYIDQVGDVYLQRVPSTTQDRTNYQNFNNVHGIQVPLFHLQFPTDIY